MIYGGHFVKKKLAAGNRSHVKTIAIWVGMSVFMNLYNYNRPFVRETFCDYLIYLIYKYIYTVQIYEG